MVAMVRQFTAPILTDYGLRLLCPVPPSEDEEMAAGTGRSLLFEYRGLCLTCLEAWHLVSVLNCPPYPHEISASLYHVFHYKVDSVHVLIDEPWISVLSRGLAIVSFFHRPQDMHELPGPSERLSL